MWWPSLLACLLLLASVHSHQAKNLFFSNGRYGKRMSQPLDPRREGRSSVFWSGSSPSRYSRRGDSELAGMKYPRRGQSQSSNFFMGSRYGKRDAENSASSDFKIDLCHFYPCGRSR